MDIKKVEKWSIDLALDRKLQAYEHVIDASFLVPESDVELLRKALMKLIAKERD